MKNNYDFLFGIYPGRRIGPYMSSLSLWKREGFFIVGFWIFHIKIAHSPKIVR